MTAPDQGICGAWATQADLCSPCDSYEVAGVDADDALEAASEALFWLSGARWPGTCTTTVRPCAQRAYNDLPPEQRVGVLSVASGCGCASRAGCGCGGLSAIQLAAPVVSITEVLVDGVALAASRYRVDDWEYLVRLADADGTNPGWPCCQRLDLASTEDDTFEVTYTWGVVPPILGAKAAAALACQILLACDPENFGKCRLPARTQQVVRQGVTVTTLAGASYAEDIRRSIPEVGLFLEAYNPGDVRRPAVVLSPDVGARATHVDT